MPTILEALAVIKGKDATGGTFDAVANKIQRITRAANALNRDVQKQLNMASVAGKQVERLDRASSAIGTGARFAAGAAAAYGAGHAATALIEHTARASAARAHEEVRMSASGMSDDEIKEAGALAADMSSKYKSLSQTEIMHTARNVRAVVGTFEEAQKIIDPLMQLRVTALGANPKHAEELGEDFDKLVKGMEIKGVTQDLPKFNHYIDGMAKAINVFGDTLRPTDYYEMFKYGRAATNALSDNFMLQTAPTLAQELGGSSAGKALSSFYTQMVGGKMSNKAVEAMQEYGLIDPDKVIKTSTGNVKGVKPGGVVGSEYLQPGSTDPYQWVNNVLLPALAKKDVTDPAKIQEVIAAIASQQTSAQMMSIFATQQSRIKKDADLVAAAKGKDAAAQFQANDPYVAAKSVASQTENLFSTLGSPMTPAATKGLNWLASGLSWANEQADKHPDRAVPAATWGTGLLGAIGIDSVRSWFGKGSWGLSKAIGSLAPILALTQLADSVMDDNDIDRLKKYESSPRYRFDQLHDLDEKDKAAGIYGDPDFEAEVKARNAAKRQALESELDGFGYNPGVTQGRYRGAGGAPWTIDDIRNATGAGGGQSVSVSVEGTPTVQSEVTVKPSSEFWATIESKISNAILSVKSSMAPPKGTSGSTGTSMPEAGPPQ
jgi:hypothetical protein